MSDMRWREFIGVLGGAAVAWPLAARAQRAASPGSGWLSCRSPEGMSAASEWLRACVDYLAQRDA